MDPNSGANFTHADRPDQPNLYFWEKISWWANLANFCPIWFKFCTECFGKPLKRFRMFEVAATIFRPTSPTNQNRPKVKIFNFRVFHLIWMKFGMGANNGAKRTSLKIPTTIFRSTSPTNQNRPKAKISNFCVFSPIWMKFGMGANSGAKTT